MKYSVQVVNLNPQGVILPTSTSSINRHPCNFLPLTAIVFFSMGDILAVPLEGT